MRGVTKKIDEYDRRLAHVKGSLTSHASEMSELFCQSINCEQVQREIESWVQIKESEFSAILNMSSNEPIIIQQKQKGRLTVRRYFLSFRLFSTSFYFRGMQRRNASWCYRKFCSLTFPYELVVQNEDSVFEIICFENRGRGASTIACIHIVCIVCFAWSILTLLC